MLLSRGGQSDGPSGLTEMRAARVLLEHALGIELRSVGGDGMSHQVDEAISLCTSCHWLLPVGFKTEVQEPTHRTN